MNITELEAGSDAWWDLVRAVHKAEMNMSKLSISIDRNGRGETMTAVKVGEATWTSHRRVTK